MRAMSQQGKILIKYGDVVRSYASEHMAWQLICMLIRKRIAYTVTLP
jgi:hypothetical protein